MQITFRPEQPADAPFMEHLYASTRIEELEGLDWPPARKEAFLSQQFEAQTRYYRQQFASAEFKVILGDGKPIGRLYLDRRPHEYRIVDIALLPEHRGKGIGTRLMADILAEASHAGKPVTIHVERFNPAQRLYARLGFRQIDDLGVYLLLEWQP